MATRRNARPLSRPQGPSSISEALEARRLLAAAPSLAGAGDVDVAYDATGTLHLAYYDAAAHTLKYASRSSAGDWTDPVVVDPSSADTGAQVSIAVDGAGLPGVAYRDATNLDLKFARRDAGGTWTAVTVDGAGKADAGVLPDLAFDGTGAPVISYYRPTGTALRLATLAAGRWKIRGLARAGGPGRAATGVAISPVTGQWAVAYQSSDGAVRYAAQVGRKVRKATVDRLSRAASGASPSVDFTADGTPGLGYYDVLRQRVKVARPEGKGWATFQVAATNGQGTGPTILINRATGEANVVFRDPAGGNTVAAGALSGTAFPLRDLTNADDASAASAPPALAMDPVGHTIVAAYPGASLGVVASLPAATGFTFSNETPDSMRISWADVATTETGYEIQRSDDIGQTFTVIGAVGANVTQFDVTGLTEARAFWFRLVTFDNAANRTTSATVFHETIASPPTNVAATAVSPNRVDVTWEDHSRELAFGVERRLVGATTWELLVLAVVDSTSYSDLSVASGTSYEYRVSSWYGGLNPCLTTATVTTPVAAPTDLTADNSIGRQVNLAWPDVNGESGYQVERSPAGSNTFSTIATVGAGVNTYADTGLAEDVAFDYRVRALDAGGAPTAPSQVASAFVRLSSPGTLGAVPLTQNSLTLNWADNSAVESGYELQMSTNGGAYTTFASLGAGVTSHDVTNLAGGSTYSFRVRARGANIDSSFSTTIEYTVAGITPGQLAALQVADGTKMDLLWTDTNAGKAAYKIERSKDGGAFSEIAVVDPGEDHYVDTGLRAASVYRYRVRSAGPWGTTGYSNVAKELDPRPTGVTATVMTQTQVKVAWKDNCPRETSYEVRYSDGVRTRTMKSGPNARGLTIRGLTPGADYTIQVVAVRDADIRWTSDAVSAVMLVAPEGLTVGVGDALGLDLSSAVTLTWEDVNRNEGGYGIERSTDGGKTFEFLADVAANETGYTDRSVPEDTTYAYRVYAFNLNGVGPASTPAANVPATWLNAPTGLVATAAGRSRINLDWTDNSGRESGYVVAMSSDGHQFFQVAELDGHATTCVVTRGPQGQPLAAGATYFFWVIATNPTNASDYSNVADVTLPA
jgi:fibronectin type 3 domain-containing protein